MCGKREARVQRLKLQHGLGRLIDSYAEGMIEKDQFTSKNDANQGSDCRDRGQA